MRTADRHLDYHTKVDEFLRWLAKLEDSSVQFINTPGVVRWNLDKSYLLQLAAAEVPIVPSLLIRRNQPVSQSLEQIKTTGWSEIVVKPTVSATAFLTFRSSTTDSDLQKYLERVREHSDIFVQPFISSIASDGEVSLVFFRGRETVYSHTVLKRPRPGEFRVQSDFGGSEILCDSPHELILFASKVLQKVPGDWTYARVDVVDWQHRALVSEVELIEPDLFLLFKTESCELFCDAVMERLARIQK